MKRKRVLTSRLKILRPQTRDVSLSKNVAISNLFHRNIEFASKNDYTHFGGATMKLRVLNYFLSIAREGNFTRAAEQLHVTQPTLSRQIAELETELGVKLFVRGKHNIVLTEDGILLKRRAQELLSLAEKTKREFLNKSENLEGTINIGGGEFLSTGVLAECVLEFQKRYPLVRYEIISGNANNIKDGIERGSLDIGLVSEPIDIRKYEFVPMPVKEEWGILTRDDSPLATLERVAPKDLLGTRLISPVSDIAETNIGKWFGPLVNKMDVVAKGNLLYNEALLAQRNIGVVIAIRLNCRYDKLRFIPFSPALETSTALIWKKEQVFSTATSAFIEFAKKQILEASAKL